MSQTSPSPFDLRPGTVLRERYELVRPFRQGGMSTTFEVTDGREGVRRELQVFPAALFEGREQAHEFARSLAHWREIEHPAVLRVREVEAYDDGTILLVTDFPRGEALRDRLKRDGREPAATARAVGIALLEGLCAIHERGQIHGDVKPSTVWVDDEGGDLRPVLTDGGITLGLWSAKHLGDKTALIGTPFYAPIEQFGGDPPNVQSDLYNVATVLYELVTGVVPWSGRSFLEIFQAKLEKAPPTMRERAPSVEVPEDFEDAVRGGLMADRHERYASADEFLDALRACA